MGLALAKVPTAQLTRRGVLRLCAVGTFGPFLPTFAQTSPTVRSVVGDAPLSESGLLLSMPLIAETGAAVSVVLEMKGTPVSRWVMIAEKNPRPIVLDLRVGALAAASSITTRVRLGATQRVLALALTRAGAWHIAGADVALTGSACYDGT